MQDGEDFDDVPGGVLHTSTWGEFPISFIPDEDEAQVGRETIIFNSSLSKFEKMKSAYQWALESTDNNEKCKALQLLNFLLEYDDKDLDFQTGKKSFELNGWLLENYDDAYLKFHLSRFSYLNNKLNQLTSERLLQLWQARHGKLDAKFLDAFYNHPDLPEIVLFQEFKIATELKYTKRLADLVRQLRPEIIYSPCHYCWHETKHGVIVAQGTVIGSTYRCTHCGKARE